MAILAPVGRDYLRPGWWVMGLQLVTGVAGFALHAAPLLTDASGPLLDRVVYGPPLFPPLLFANLALLAGLGLWDMAEKPLPEASGEDGAALEQGSREMQGAEAG